MNRSRRSVGVALLVTCAIAVFSLVLSRASRSQPAPKTADLPAALAADWLPNGIAVAPGQVVDNVVVFPILAKAQQHVGDLVTLDDAIASGQAELTEVGASSGNGAQVGTLIIKNKGNRPIFVLGGTIVVGGKQDRQIGQDVIVDPKKSEKVSAFCVEHGRWTVDRAGRATGGKFVAMKQLATSPVRAAGQYAMDQGDVWNEVAKTNAAQGKAPASGTLVATLGDAALTKRRDALAAKINAVLQRPELAPWLVGYAYAIGGQVRGVRWFAHRRVFELFRTTLVNTAAMDALTSGARAPAQPLAAKAVKQFVADVDAAHDKQVRAAAQNANEYKASSKGYGSKTMLKAASPAAPAREVSSDYVAK
jgi:hypothetical protein